MTAAPGWAWAATGFTILCLLTIDLLASRREPRMATAVLGSAAWVGAAIVFGLVLALSQGGTAGEEYFTAYLVEKALSVDNLFVFALLFKAFAVPGAYQHRVLFGGVVGALFLRGGFIAAGAALIEQLSWAFYVFGALLLLAAVRMARGGVHIGPGGGLVSRGLRKILPITEEYDGPRFLTRSDGRLAATPLLVVLVTIETTDLIFAIDSIPAAFGVTTDLFIVFTSGAFAILGLRALYFVLAGAMERFAYLSQGLAVMLAFIGAKMILAPVLHLPTVVSLGTVTAIVASAIFLSVWKLRREARSAPAPGSGSASSSTPAPGSGSTPAPGSSSTPAPGSSSTPAPGSSSTPAPGSGSIPAPAPAPDRLTPRRQPCPCMRPPQRGLRLHHARPRPKPAPCPGPAAVPAPGPQDNTRAQLLAQPM